MTPTRTDIHHLNFICSNLVDYGPCSGASSNGVRSIPGIDQHPVCYDNGIIRTEVGTITVTMQDNLAHCSSAVCQICASWQVFWQVLEAKDLQRRRESLL